MMPCPHRKGPACSLIAQAAGITAPRVEDARCAVCPSADDGKGYASQMILAHLRLRIVQRWQKADPCCGTTTKLSEALERLKARVGPEEAGRAILEAVKFGGMPKDKAKELAKTHLGEATA